MTTSPATKRPFIVSFTTFLVWINGLLGVVLGMMLLFSEDLRSVAQIPTAVITLITGVLTILVSLALLQANPLARMLVTVFQTVSLLSALVHLLITRITIFADVTTILLSAVIISLLWSGQLKTFFK